MAEIYFFFILLSIFFNKTFPFPSKSFIQRNSHENMLRLMNLSPYENAEELSGQFEGDIIISPKQLNELFKQNSKTGLIDLKYRWTNNIVPYQIKVKDFDTAQIHHIENAIRTLENATCIKFVEYQADVHVNYVWVTGEDGGCYSSVGMQGGRQRLNLQSYKIESGCFRLYTIVHEFIHALGFYHMQSASNRDDYVKIVWKNIQDGAEHNFNAYSADKIHMYGEPYDYESVMHYSDTAFSKNGEKTIIPLTELNDGVTMGQRVKMTQHDIDRINAMYCK
ncbi:hypothetical protein PVAND_007506 [Polypedilum vanderplanki]|uniref:Metalloendopeptidase n=1 Tax=Polypedilum vanderplanki TaxID=319348 RepID=A0A9J6C743_POLVA|nr:hypothetical protein PVAND_007506 [Polypedilum vanderplanki]